MYRIGIKVKRFLLVTGDFLVFFCSLFLTLSLRYGTISSGIWDAHVVPFFIISIAWLVTFYISGLYDLSLTTDSFRFLRTFLESMLINLGLALGFFYLVPFLVLLHAQT